MSTTQQTNVTILVTTSVSFSIHRHSYVLDRDCRPPATSLSVVARCFNTFYVATWPIHPAYRFLILHAFFLSAFAAKITKFYFLLYNANWCVDHYHVNVPLHRMALWESLSNTVCWWCVPTLGTVEYYLLTIFNILRCIKVLMHALRYIIAVLVIRIK